MWRGNAFDDFCHDIPGGQSRELGLRIKGNTVSDRRLCQLLHMIGSDEFHSVEDCQCLSDPRQGKRCARARA